MLLGIDCETTGFPLWNSPSTAPGQPHLVQLAMVLMEDDFTERASASLIIKPDGWVIPDEAAQIHGIDTAMATRLGVPEKLATDLYVSLLYGTGAQALGHNAPFDQRIMRIAMLRAGYTKPWLDARPVETICTMRAARPILGLPHAPSLSDCIEFFFQEKLEGAHDAMIDVRACLRVHRRLAGQLANPPPPIMRDPIGTELGAEDTAPRSMRKPSPPVADVGDVV